MNNREKLAVLTAVEKGVKERIKEVREDADEEFRTLMESEGVDRCALMAAGANVGTMTAAYEKEGFEIDDRAAFEEWALCNGLASVKRSISPLYMEAALNIVARELPEAIREDTVLADDWEKAMDTVGDAVVAYGTTSVVPGVAFRPKAYKGTIVRGCKPEDVLPLLRQLPGGMDALLLGGGADD